MLQKGKVQFKVSCPVRQQVLFFHQFVSVDLKKGHGFRIFITVSLKDLVLQIMVLCLNLCHEILFLHTRQGFPRFSPVLDISVLYEGVKDNLRVSILTSFCTNFLDRSQTEHFFLENIVILVLN